MAYVKRLADNELKKRLEYSGGVLVEGPKYCGKTETSRQLAKSVVRFDVDSNIDILMQTDPFLLLAGEKPCLLDEWQEQPAIWNFVRRNIDDSVDKGQYILTGSANPEEDTKLHTGAGRISKMRMRTLSWQEMGYSTGEVKLEQLFGD
jgi:predicted AAA+ superfamily ATPase